MIFRDKNKPTICCSLYIAVIIYVCASFKMLCKRLYHFSYLPSDWLTFVWTHPLSQIGNTWVLLQHFCPTMIIWWFPLLFMVPSVVWLRCAEELSAQNQHFGWFPSLFMVPSLFGSNVFSTQNQYFGWFSLLLKVSSFVWLQSVLCSKSTIWVVPFTFYGSRCLAFLYFPLKINILGGSLHFLRLPVLFGSNMFSSQNQYFGWNSSLYIVFVVV